MTEKNIQKICESSLDLKIYASLVPHRKKFLFKFLPLITLTPYIPYTLAWALGWNLTWTLTTNSCLNPCSTLSELPQLLLECFSDLCLNLAHTMPEPLSNPAWTLARTLVWTIAQTLPELLSKPCLNPYLTLPEPLPRPCPNLARTLVWTIVQTIAFPNPCPTLPKPLPKWEFPC